MPASDGKAASESVLAINKNSDGLDEMKTQKVIVGAMVQPGERIAVEQIAAKRGWTLSKCAAEAIRQWIVRELSNPDELP